MKIPLIDMQGQIQSLKPEILAAVEKFLDCGSFIMGQEVAALEQRFCAETGAGHAVSCNSGTDALLLILEGLGIGAGAEVITTPFTFFATAESISRAGATPVFVDVDRDTFNLDPQKLAQAITARTKAIMPVHIFGQPADMEPMMALAARHGLKVIEDACQAVGAAYTFADGSVKQAGAIGDAAAFSFYPTKNLGAYGDGGMVTTNDGCLAQVIKGLRVHGSGANGKTAYELLYNEAVELGLAPTGGDATVYDPTKYYNFLIGMNSRLDTLQAVILNVKMNSLREWNSRRQELSRRYRMLLAENDLLTVLRPQQVIGQAESVYHLFAVVCEEKEALADYLRRRGIATGMYYPVPLHLQKVYRQGPHKLAYQPGDLPVSEWLCRRTLALPLYPELTDGQQDEVVQAIRQFYRER